MGDATSKIVKNHSFIQNMLDRQFCENKWVYLYRKDSEKLDVYCKKEAIDKYVIMYTYLIPDEITENCLKQFSADIEISDAAALWGDDSYERYYKNNIQLLVTEINFSNIRPRKSQLRIHEDIIYMFNLYEKSYDDFSKDYYEYSNGESRLIATIRPNVVKILHSYLVTFIKSKQMNLVCYGRSELNCNPEYNESIYDDYTGFEGRDVSTDSNCNYNHSSVFNIDYQNWFIGKRIFHFSDYKDFKSVLDPIYESFIVGYDPQSGKNIEISCDDDNHKYKRVFFKKSVLEKYRYDSESKIEQYNVSSTYFSIKCDTCNDEYVWTHLKDLRCISYSEQQHWKVYNILPIENCESQYYRECIIGQNWNPKQTFPDYKFRNLMYRIREIWKHKYGWYLFKEIEGVQANYPLQLFTLTENKIRPLKDFISKFNIVITESINVSSIKHSGCEAPKESKSIFWLEEYLNYLKFDKSKEFILCIRDLNTLRSKLTDSHIDALDFDKTTIKSLKGFGIEADNISWHSLDMKLLSRNIFIRFNSVLNSLIQFEQTH